MPHLAWHPRRMKLMYPGSSIRISIGIGLSPQTRSFRSCGAITGACVAPSSSEARRDSPSRPPCGLVHIAPVRLRNFCFAKDQASLPHYGLLKGRFNCKVSFEQQARCRCSHDVSGIRYFLRNCIKQVCHKLMGAGHHCSE